MKVYQAVLDQLIGSGVEFFSGMIGSTVNVLTDYGHNHV